MRLRLSEQNKAEIAQASKSNCFIAASRARIAGEENRPTDATVPCREQGSRNRGFRVAAAAKFRWRVDSSQLNDIG